MGMWKTQKAAFPTFPQAPASDQKRQIKGKDPNQNQDPGGDFYVITGGKIT